MKLVEILARDLSTWPSDLVLVQGAGGSVYEAGGGQFIGYYDMAEDWTLAEVTQPQWQAERDRMRAMEKEHIKALHTQGVMNVEEFIEAWTKATANAKPMPFEPIPEPTYEQQLWDRVASSFIHNGSSTTVAFMNADHFMAERAKRIKGE